MNPTRYQELEKNFSTKRVMVVGDLMLDNYLWGDASRISPEAPVPVVRIDSSSRNPGGAGNVANNLRSLGASVVICGCVGDDNDGAVLRSVLGEMGAETEGIVVDPARPTTVKTRIIARNHQVVRTDWEDTSPVDDEIQKAVISKVRTHLKSCDAVILEDYDKGFLNKGLIKRLIDMSKAVPIPVYADPKFDNFFSYKKVVLVKPNLEEAARAMGMDLSSEESLEQAGLALREKLMCDMVLVTRGELGMSLFDQSGHSLIPTKARGVHDVSGAGDTVISAFCLAHLSGASPVEAAEVANFAAGRVCEEAGVVPITRETLHEIIIDHHS